MLSRLAPETFAYVLCRLGHDGNLLGRICIVCKAWNDEANTVQPIWKRLCTTTCSVIEEAWKQSEKHDVQASKRDCSCSAVEVQELPPVTQPATWRELYSKIRNLMMQKETCIQGLVYTKQEIQDMILLQVIKVTRKFVTVHAETPRDVTFSLLLEERVIG